MVGTVKKDVFVSIKFSTEQLSNLNTKVQGLKRNMTEMNRNITATSLNMQKTTSKAWKKRFRNMNIGLKEQRLGMQRTLDTTNNAFGKERENLNKLNGVKDEGIRQTKVLARQTKLFNKAMSGGAQGLVNNATNTEKLGKAFDSFGGAMGMPIKKWQQFNMQGGQFDKLGGRLGNRFRMLTHGMRGFRMEMLGVMFFGMGMMNFFKGMLKPAGDMIGLFEIWTVILQVLFLPIMIELLPYLIDLLNWVLEMSPEMKKWAGIIALAGVALGGFLFLVGMMSLGLGSIVQVFGKVFKFLFSKFGLILLGVILIVTGFVLIFKKKWEGLGLIIMGIGLILLAFGYWWALIPIAVGLAIFLIIKYWVHVKYFLKNLWLGITISFLKEVDKWQDAILKLLEYIRIVKKVTFQDTSFIDSVMSGIKGVKSIIGALQFEKDVLLPAERMAEIGQQARIAENQANTKESSFGGNILSDIEGFKNGGTTNIINQENNFNVSDGEEFQKYLDENNEKVIEDLKRIAPTGG